MEATQQRETLPVLRPLSLGELLDRAFSLYRDRFFLFLGVGLVPQAVAFSIALGTDAMVYFRYLNPSRSAVFVLVALFLITLPIRMMALAISQAMTMPVVSSAYLQHPITLRETFLHAKSCLGRLFWLAMQTTIRVTLGLLLLVFPGVLLTLNYAVSVPAAVFEDLKARDALERSTELTSGYRGRIFGLYFFYELLNIAVTQSARYLVHLRHLGFVGVVFFELVKILSSSFATPLLLITFALLYYDLRVRKEGFDLDFMMKSLDQAPVAAQTANA